MSTLRSARIGIRSLSTPLRRLLLIALDGGFIAASFWLAYALRFGEALHPHFLTALPLLPLAVLLGLGVFIASGWYRGLTRYSGSHSLYGLLPRAALMVLLLLLAATLLAPPIPPFRSFWLLFWLLFCAMAIASRVMLRDLLRLHLARTAAPAAGPDGPARQDHQRPTVVYGARRAAASLVAELRFEPRFRLVAILDDDTALHCRRLGGLPIHPPAELPQLIERFGVSQVLLAVPAASRPQRLALVERFTAMGLRVLSIPSLASLAAGEQAVSDLRPVQIEELLGRDPSPPDPVLLRAAVSCRSVLVTGAGGSIGSELCRQIRALGPQRLVLLERNEYALYQIDAELRAAQPAGPLERVVEVVAVLGDVLDGPRLQALCRRHRVQVIVHAAAYKHVPLVETNLCVGVANNVLGTRSALEAAWSTGVERFLLVSTDKAVRPTNVMGASKRACELLVQDAAARAERRGGGPVFAMVRFGNVLGSSGSVVPLFRAQIAAGGPVTVTHPEITRYFMTIPEAAQLVLQAAGMARGGEVFVLDMGEPVKIVDLARQMIHLSGCSEQDRDHPQGDIPIRFTGLRPGEKLYEELIISDTDITTSHPLIRKAREACLPRERLLELMAALVAALEAWDEPGVRSLLRQMVPEYRPARLPGQGD